MNNGQTVIIWETNTPAEITDSVRYKLSRFMKKHSILNLFLHTEIRHKNIIYRAHPNYRGCGHWYDWCMVRFDLTEDDDIRREENMRLGITTAYPVGHYPAKILGFFMYEGKIHCLIHCCEYKKTSIKDSCLTECWDMEYVLINKDKGTGRKKDVYAKLRICDMACIDDRIFVIEESPGVHYIKGEHSSSVILVKKRYMWAPYFTNTI